MFGNARAYLGTLFSVFDAEAQEICGLLRLRRREPRRQ